MICIYIYQYIYIHIMSSTLKTKHSTQQQQQPIHTDHHHNYNHSHDDHSHNDQYQSHPPIPHPQSQSPHQQSIQPHKQPPIKFGKQSITLKCPFCLQRTRTQIIMKPQLISIMLALLLFTLLPNAVMIVLIVLVLQITATKRHRCSLCERQLGTDGKFLIIFTDQVYSWSFGQTGILISKKIIMTIGLVMLTILLIYIKSNAIQQYNWIDLTWAELKNKCPYQTISIKCNQQLQQKTIKNWKGYVMRVQDRRQSMRRYYDHAVQIYVKMDPPQRQNKIPDLYLFGSSSMLGGISDVLDKLTNGDQIMFNATFQVNRNGNGIGNGIGNGRKNGQVGHRFMEIVGIEKTGRRNQSIEVYMSVKEEEYFVKNVEGKALRKEENV